MFYSFSEQTKYLRYHGTLKAMPHNKLQVFCNVDYDTEMALVVVNGTRRPRGDRRRRPLHDQPGQAGRRDGLRRRR